MFQKRSSFGKLYERMPSIYLHKNAHTKNDILWRSAPIWMTTSFTFHSWYIVFYVICRFSFSETGQRNSLNRGDSESISSQRISGEVITNPRDSLASFSSFKLQVCAPQCVMCCTLFHHGCALIDHDNKNLLYHCALLKCHFAFCLPRYNNNCND